MSDPSEPVTPAEKIKKQHPFRRAVLRGLAVILPPLLTIVLFIWAWNTIDSYVLGPIEACARYVLVWSLAEVRDEPPAALPRQRGPNGEVLVWQDGQDYVALENGQWIPYPVYTAVRRNPGEVERRSAEAYYHRYVKLKYLQRRYVVPVFLLVFILTLYLLGKFLAAGVGRMLWNMCESIIHRLPVIRNVYSSVKQVTDFVFSEQELEYTRVVAVQYPRKGIWSIGFVTGESMLDIRSAANEPVLSVLMPTSPMPATGFAVTVLKSETIDLNISIDQAIQFVVSCGVVVPAQQQYADSEVGARIAAAVARREAERVRASEQPALATDTGNEDER